MVHILLLSNTIHGCIFVKKHFRMHIWESISAVPFLFSCAQLIQMRMHLFYCHVFLSSMKCSALHLLPWLNYFEIFVLFSNLILSRFIFNKFYTSFSSHTQNYILKALLSSSMSLLNKTKRHTRNTRDN